MMYPPIGGVPQSKLRGLLNLLTLVSASPRSAQQSNRTNRIPLMCESDKTSRCRSRVTRCAEAPLQRISRAMRTILGLYDSSPDSSRISWRDDRGSRLGRDVVPRQGSHFPTEIDETDILHDRLLSLVALRYESPDPRGNLRTANRGRSFHAD